MICTTVTSASLKFTLERMRRLQLEDGQTQAAQGLGAHVVKNLTCSLVGKNYYFMDNFFSSVDLSYLFSKKKIIVVEPCAKTGEAFLLH